MLNPFFLQGSSTEKGLIQDLINEQLKMYGIDVHYLPRQYITETKVIKEVIESQFSSAYPIEAYIDTYEGYSDNPTILSKFGIQALNEITLIISRERFKNYISPLMQNLSNIKVYTRPREGDLIYFPLGKRLFEIKYVEHEKPFYQLQGLYTYQLRCELFRYEDELIDTSITEVDQVILGPGGAGGGGDGPGSGGGGTGGGIDDPFTLTNLVTLNMVGVGVTAEATASIVNGGVRYINVTNRGGGYTSVPSVGISSAPSGGKTCSAIAELIGGIVVCNENINPQSKSVQRVLITNSGYGYTVPPGVRFIGGGGQGATANAVIGDGIVGIVTITNPGSGYILPPTITVNGLSTVTATVAAVVSGIGSIESIYITNAGLGYTQPPVITIQNPTLNSFGSFVYNELVTGTESGVKARVKSWNAVTNTLKVSNVTGTFIIGENIVGSASSASHYLKSFNILALKDGYSQNDEIEDEADKIIDFSEINPFGTP